MSVKNLVWQKFLIIKKNKNFMYRLQYCGSSVVSALASRANGTRIDSRLSKGIFGV